MLTKAGKLIVTNASGEMGSIPNTPDAQQDAQRRGYRIATDEEVQSKRDLREYGESIGAELVAGVAGVARGLTFGLSDLALTKLDVVEPETLEKYKRFNPTASIGGEIGGAILPLIVSGGSSALATGVKTAGTLPRVVSAAGRGTEAAIASALLAKGGTSIASKAIPKIAGSMVEGAFYGAGQIVTESALGETDLNAESLLAGAAKGALMGAAIPAAAAVFKSSAGLVSRKIGSSKSAEWITGKAKEKLSGSSAKEKLARWFKKTAEHRAVKSLGPSKKDQATLQKYGREKTLGRWMLDRKIVTATSTLDSVKTSLTSKLDDASNALEKAIGKLDKLVVGQRGMVRAPGRIAAEIDAQILKPLKDVPVIANLPIIKNIEKQKRQILKKYPNGLSFTELEKLKKSFSPHIRYAAGVRSPQQDALAGIQKIIKKHSEKIADKVEARLLVQKPSGPNAVGIATAFKEAKKDYGFAKEALDIVENSIIAADRNRTFSLTDYISTGPGAASGVAGAIIGGPTGAATGAVAAGLGNKLMRERSNQIIAAGANFMVPVLSGVERQTAGITSKIFSGVSKFIKKETKIITPVAVKSLLYGTDKQKDHKKHAEAISEAMVKPEQTISAIVDQTQGLYRAAPRIAKQFNEKLFNSIKFLDSKLPKNPHAGSIQPYDWEPSDYQIAKYQRYQRAVLDPMSVMDDLTREGVEVLRFVYPRLYQELQFQVMDRVGKLRDTLPYEKRLALSILLEVPLEPTLRIKFSALSKEKERARGKPIKGFAKSEGTSIGRIGEK